MLIFLSSIPLRSGLALKYQKVKKLPTIMSRHWTGQCIDGHISEMVGSLNVSVNDAMIQPSSELTVHHFYVLKKVRISFVNLDDILNNESMTRIIQTRTFWYSADGDVICGGNVLSSNPLDFDATWKCDKCGKTTKWDQNGLAGIEKDLSSRLDDNENDIKVVNVSSLLHIFLTF